TVEPREPEESSSHHGGARDNSQLPNSQPPRNSQSPTAKYSLGVPWELGVGSSLGVAELGVPWELRSWELLSSHPYSRQRPLLPGRSGPGDLDQIVGGRERREDDFRREPARTGRRIRTLSHG